MITNLLRNMGAWFSPRRYVQFGALGALNSRFLEVSTGKFCLPVMNCEACALAWFICPVGVARNALAYQTIPWMFIGMLVLFGIFVGRMFCGWICPAGLVQDLLYKIPSPKIRFPAWSRYTKYVVLVLGVVAAAWFLGSESLLFFCNYCPVAAVQVVVPSMFQYGDWYIGVARGVRFGVLGMVIVLSIMGSRAFCTLFCPVGAVIALTSKLGLRRLHIKEDACIKCKKCDRSCPGGLPVMANKGSVLHQAECIGCLDCKKSCPVNAMKLGLLPQKAG